MSYAIVRIQKMTSGSVKGIQIHDQREKEYSHSNPDIDFSKSHLNEDLHNSEKVNFNHKVKERIQELNLPKAIRKDAIVMTQCLVTSDKQFFDKMSQEGQRKFFQDGFNFIKDRYGEKNIVSATVHYDEKTPHMHVNFVPVTEDGRLSAKDLFKRKDLMKLHDDFHKYCKQHGYELERGESKGEFKKHLTVEEYKLETKKQEIEKTKSELEKVENALQSDYKTVKNVQSTIYELERLDVKKSLIGGKLTISEKDYSKLLDTAKQGVYKSNEVYDLKREIKGLKEDIQNYKEVKDKDSNIITELRTQNLKLKKGVKDLQEKGKAMFETLKKHDLVPEAQDFLKNMRETEQPIPKVKAPTKDWDMER